MNCYNKFFGIFLSLIIALIFANVSHAVVPIDATKNAAMHNNKGVNYLNEGDYYAAISSFGIALGLNPTSEMTATVYGNLGQTYLKIGYYNYAQQCFENAIQFSPMTFNYYQNLVFAYKKQGILNKKLHEHKKIEGMSEEVLNGLIYVEMGEISTGYNILRNFAQKQPKLIITPAIINYTKTISDL